MARFQDDQSKSGERNPQRGPDDSRLAGSSSKKLEAVVRRIVRRAIRGGDPTSPLAQHIIKMADGVGGEHCRATAEDRERLVAHLTAKISRWVRSLQKQVTGGTETIAFNEETVQSLDLSSLHAQK